MAGLMSGGGALQQQQQQQQQRTTYLISLTLVKVEAVDEDGGGPARPAGGTAPGSPQPSSALPTGAAGPAHVENGAGPEEETPDPASPAPPSAVEKTPGRRTPPAEPGHAPSRAGPTLRASGQRPVSLLKSHSRREGRDRSPTSAQSLDRKDCRGPMSSPGPCRASWAEASRSEGWKDDAALEAGGGTGAVMRDLPRKERLKTGSASLPAPSSLSSKPARKGKSRTLDNSDLSSLSEDLGLTRDLRDPQQQGPPGQRGPNKDRKMLKFISGIFTKSTSATGGSSTAPPVYIQRDSSEEEVNISNSQEWSLSRSIPELRLGILGSLKSGRSALVHKYVTGSYVAVEKPEGGRFKKEVLVDGQSQLLLIREEAGPPDAQFSSWVDAVLLVFSLENEASFLELYQLFSQLNASRSDLPIIVVGTQDKISSSNPRVIDDQRARQLCIDVRHSLFYETCATYGFNVDRVFSEAAQKIVAQKKQAALQACKSLPNSPSHSGGSTPGSAHFPGQVAPPAAAQPRTANSGRMQASSNGGHAYSLPSTPVVPHREHGGGGATPRSLRSIPRRPSLFKKGDSEKKASAAGGDGKGDPGAVRGTPLKQGVLWKRSGSSLNKEWKKKFVTLSNSGSLSYHSSSSDYAQNAHGKEIDLLRVTVKVPGKRPPKAVAPVGPSPAPPGSTPGVNGLSTTPALAPPDGTSSASALSVGEERPAGGERGLQRCPSSLSTKAQSVDALEGAAARDPPGQSSPMGDRKKNRRKKSMNQRGDAAVGQAEDEENADFIIVSSSGQMWHFEAPSQEERDSWVLAIESQILASLQSCESARNKARRSSQSEAVALQAIRNTKGNHLCVDCDAPNPTWASLNLGALICIECSGIHRNLGTHLSRVRSLDLDDWPGELTQVLAAIGNHMANSVWESCTQGRTKPSPTATREERETWIRAKYEQRAFVAALQPGPGAPPPEGAMAAWLLSAVTERDLPRLLLLLAHSTKEQINHRQPAGPDSSSPAPRTALHAACQLGDVVMTQLLVWYGIDVRATDSQGQTAHRIARKTGSRGCMDILLQHGCPSDATPPNATPVLSRRSSTASLGHTSSRKRVS
ncbi:arf-GAP with GTPase, ANK repeat and PH domain-containing protein 1-like isoform X3 [Nelusetta ayraudi]|uniref:arf-GAP with GTPase, ANK repeat and PH domain-containing protein 1-like isoform X3 n=1 Tax=Nelusetta ayraudi TaxID=303726 RepID=UPI003F718B0F